MISRNRSGVVGLITILSALVSLPLIRVFVAAIANFGTRFRLAYTNLDKMIMFLLILGHLGIVV